MSFGSAIQDHLVSQLNSKAEANSPIVVEFVKQMKSESDALALSTVSSAAMALAKAKEEGQPQSVVDAYERIMLRASSR